jgi:heme A synthase
MTRRFTRLAWTAATFTYLLIVLGAIVRITGSGLGCGEQWPLCRGRLLPPLDLPTLIEYGHRLTALAVSLLVLALAAWAWWLRRVGRVSRSDEANGPTPLPAELAPAARPSVAPYLALGLLVLQVALGAVTVRLRLPAWTVILHLGTAMLLLATLIVVARGPGGRAPARRERGIVGLGFVTVLFGALTANLGAASACLGFPLCSGQLVPDGTYLQHIQWTHRLLAYALFAAVLWWAARAKRGGPWGVLALVALQVVVAAAMVLLARPPALQAAHAAVGTAVWAGLVGATR